MSEKVNTFETLNNINLKDKVQEKIGLKYLSWAYAWGELKKAYPEAVYTIYTRSIKTTHTETTTDPNGGTTTVVTESTNDIPYFTDGKTCYVKVGVTIEGTEYVELLPVMDNRNSAVPLAMITMTAVNKALQRAFVKACARHGLGLYIYAGEDLPEVEKKVIDFKAIETNCDRYAVTTLSQEGFDTMLKSVAAFIQSESTNYPADVQQAITNYVVKNNKGKRLGMFTLAEDSINLQRIYNFINEVKKAFAAPNGK